MRCFVATSKATVYKSGIGKYIATEAAAGDSKGKGGDAAGMAADGTKAKSAPAPAVVSSVPDEEEDMWANVVPVKKVKVQPKAGFGDFSGW